MTFGRLTCLAMATKLASSYRLHHCPKADAVLRRWALSWGFEADAAQRAAFACMETPVTRDALRAFCKKMLWEASDPELDAVFDFFKAVGGGSGPEAFLELLSAHSPVRACGTAQPAPHVTALAHPRARASAPLARRSQDFGVPDAPVTLYSRDVLPTGRTTARHGTFGRSTVFSDPEYRQ